MRYHKRYDRMASTSKSFLPACKFFGSTEYDIHTGIWKDESLEYFLIVKPKPISLMRVWPSRLIMNSLKTEKRKEKKFKHILIMVCPHCSGDCKSCVESSSVNNPWNME